MMTLRTIIGTTTCIIMISLATSNPTKAQQADGFGAASKTELFQYLPSLIKNNYVFPEIGDKISESLKSKISKGYFDQFSDKESFVEAVNSEIRSVNGDLHLRVKSLAMPNEDDAILSYSGELLTDYNKSRMEFAGFDGVRNLGEGIGYLKLSYFRNAGMVVADSYMELLRSSDAVIIDLRDNHGGTAEMVQYLLSYFFGQPIQISTV